MYSGLDKLNHHPFNAFYLILLSSPLSCEEEVRFTHKEVGERWQSFQRTVTVSGNLSFLGFPTGPFTSSVGHQAALDQIAQMRSMLNAMREEENTLRSNLGIFKIEQPVSKDLQNLEKVGYRARPSW